MRQGRMGLIGALAVLALGVAGPARAADDGYANVFSSIATAFGVIKEDPAPDISYRERPPLVLPPQAGLPKPVDHATKSAAWPNDPDVLRYKKEKEEALAPRVGRDEERNDKLSAAELAKGRAANAGIAPRSDCNPDSSNRACLLVSPDELKREGDLFAAANPTSTDEVIAGQEPERVYLTQPPKGYLKPTRTVKATAEAPIQKVDESSPRVYFEKTNKDE